MPNILFVSAMEEEIFPLQHELTVNRDAYLPADCRVDFLVTREGKINATKSLVCHIERSIAYNRSRCHCNLTNNLAYYDLVLNVGTCAGIKNANVFDVFNSIMCASVDTDYCGGVSKTLPICLDGSKYSIMLSNDRFMSDKYYHFAIEPRLKYFYENGIISESCPVVYDMESYAFSSICEDYGIQFCAVRIVTDIVKVGDMHSEFKQNLNLACKKLSEVVLKNMNQIIKQIML